MVRGSLAELVIKSLPAIKSHTLTISERGLGTANGQIDR